MNQRPPQPKPVAPANNLKTMHWTHLDKLHTEVRRELRSRKDWRYGPERVHEVAKEGFDAVKPYAPVAGQRYCDLGCGIFHPFGVSTAMFLNGAESTLALDLHDSNAERAAEALSDLLLDCLAFPDKWHWSGVPRDEFFARIRRFDLAALANGKLREGVAGLPLRHCVTDIHNPVLEEESIDLMTSRAVLEHFLDFGVAVERFYALLRPGGVASHLIDIVDHRAYESPKFHYWSFLAEDESWSDGLVNRLRSCEIRPHFERAGFEILRYDNRRGALPAGFRARVAGRFQAMSDEELSITTVHCILRKPARVTVAGHRAAAPEQPKLQLPPTAAFRQACAQANGWSDHYGAMHVAANYAKAPLAAPYALKGIWQHGCHGPWSNLSPGVLCSNAPDAKTRPLFVARRDQEEFLRGHGFKQVRAIGLPIAYTEAPPLKRVPGSLLVVPTHTLVGDAFADRSQFDRYAEEIRGIAGGFARVTVCVHPNCRMNGLWVDEFSSRGFEVVFGAQTSDANALLRMRMLFEQFETVTTNGWGSHVAYALAFGARVSIWGTKPAKDTTDYLKDQAWAADPGALKKMLSPEVAAAEREYLKAFLVPPAEAVADRERGRWLIGADLRVSPEEMKAVLGALVAPVAAAPVAAVAAPQNPQAQLEESRRSRRQVRELARELVQAGRRGEAIAALARAARADVASRNALIIVEGLVEIGDDLESLEPSQAKVLSDHAARFAEANGLDLAAIRARVLPVAAATG